MKNGPVRGGSTRNYDQNSGFGFKSGREKDDKEQKTRKNYGSFGSFGSINKSSERKSNKQPRVLTGSDFDSNGSVEMLMMKSAKSANVALNKAKSEMRGFAKGGFRRDLRQHKSGNAKNKSVFEKNQQQKIKSYFREAESLGHMESGSFKIGNIVSQVCEGAQSQYSGQSFKPVEPDANGIAMDDTSPCHSPKAKNMSFSQDPVFQADAGTASLRNKLQDPVEEFKQ